MSQREIVFMKVGDLVKWKDVIYLVTKEWTHIMNLKQVGDNQPPYILDKGLANIYQIRGEIEILSNKL
tara:strand:- start:644 stop:847 length:204 start_codon:yes stop_codon:yes gene_type:complete